MEFLQLLFRRPTLQTPTKYTHLIMDSLLCPWEKKAYTFSINSTWTSDTLLIWTLCLALSVSVLTGFDCFCTLVTYEG